MIQRKMIKEEHKGHHKIVRRPRQKEIHHLLVQTQTTARYHVRQQKEYYHPRRHRRGRVGSSNGPWLYLLLGSVNGMVLGNPLGYNDGCNEGAEDGSVLRAQRGEAQTRCSPHPRDLTKKYELCLTRN